MNLASPEQREERNWAMACHLAGLSLYIGIPFGNILGPLLVWLLKKDQFPLVDDQGREAVNFNISMTIYFLVCFLLALVLIGIPGLIVMPFVHVLLIVIGASRAANGEGHRYPFTMHFIS